MKRLKKILMRLGVVLAAVLLIGGGVLYVFARRSVIPDNINMSSSSLGDMTDMDMNGMDMSNMDMGKPGADVIPITHLVAPQIHAPLKAFTLTAQATAIDLGNDKTVDAYTFNGTVPGPELRVQQGDRVVVTLINKLPVATTIHWHGMSVPNAEDGVAGLTQDAVKPGESHTYRFMANDVGTYWYHSHQETSIQLPLGMYGAIIVEPKTPPVHYDRDYTVFLHEWGASMDENPLTHCHATCAETLTVNDRTDKIFRSAKPGEMVRLRVANSGNDVHMPVLVGAPFKVIALDGHDLNRPSLLSNVALPIGPAQRYDLSFVMPSSGSVALIDADSRADPPQHPMVVLGGDPTSLAYPTDAIPFDFTTYGAPSTDPITLNLHFDVQYDMALGTQPGFYDGKFALTFPINGVTYPTIPSIKVKMGNLIKLHITGGGMFPFPHAMHLHGHVFTVLAHNGKPLAGSPVHVDTILVNPDESYDVAFRADNPGLWMLHCHMVEHDSHGMDMMIEYPNIYTPYTIGTTSGNNPF